MRSHSSSRLATILRRSSCGPTPRGDDMLRDVQPQPLWSAGATRALVASGAARPARGVTCRIRRSVARRYAIRHRRDVVNAGTDKSGGRVARRAKYSVPRSKTLIPHLIGFRRTADRLERSAARARRPPSRELAFSRWVTIVAPSATNVRRRTRVEGSECSRGSGLACSGRAGTPR